MLEGIVLLAPPASSGREVPHSWLRHAGEQAEGLRPEPRDSAFRARFAEADSLRREQLWLRFLWDARSPPPGASAACPCW